MRILRKPEVQKRTGLSGPTIWRMEKVGKFPKRRQISPGTVGWVDEEVDEWIGSRAVASGPESAR